MHFHVKVISKKPARVDLESKMPSSFQYFCKFCHLKIAMCAISRNPSPAHFKTNSFYRKISSVVQPQYNIVLQKILMLSHAILILLCNIILQMRLTAWLLK